MADETTTRLGLPIYTSGSSAHPIRQDFNERMELLDEQVVVKRAGALDDRPLPGDLPAGVVWEQTDAPYDLWWNTGQEWLQFARIGNGGAGRPLAIGGAGAEGTSNRAARGDHTHPLPMASASQDGALSAADKAMLNTASSNATGNALARRNGSGQMSTANPTSAGHAANRGWVQGQITDAVEDLLQSRTRITGGDLNGRTTAGAWSIWSGDFDNVANLPPASSSIILIVTPGPSGFVRQDATNTFSGARWWRARTSSSWTSWYRVVSLSQAEPYFDDLEAATWQPEVGTLVRRSAVNGRIRVGDPSGLDDATTRRYVDSEVSASANTLTNRMDSADEALSDRVSENEEALDSATWDSEPGTLVRRGTASNNFYIDEGHNTGHAAQRGWVQDQISSAVEDLPQARGRIRSGDLNDYRKSGAYYVYTTDFSSISNLPRNLTNSGLYLRVTSPGDGSGAIQEAWDAYWSDPSMVFRTSTGSTWSDWKRVVTE